MKSLLELGERIQRERIAQEKKQEDLAAEAAVSRRTVIKLENGDPVTTRTLQSVLAALGYGDALENLLPPPVVSPIDLQKLEGKKRQRVR